MVFHFSPQTIDDMGWSDFLGLCDQLDVMERERAKAQAEERLHGR